MKPLLKKTCLSVICLLAATNTMAYDFEYEGCYFDIISETNKTCKITYKNFFEETETYIGNFEIPDHVYYNNERYMVTEICKMAFYGCSSLTSVNIPESVTFIGNRAFHACSSLTEINIPESVTSIGKLAFAYCSSLTEINIPKGVTSIGSSAFFGCSSLTSINIPEGVTEIGYNAFENCSKLTEINIPKSVTEIGEEAFKNCSSLTSINIPNGVKATIGMSAFMFCSGLTSITIPNTVNTMSLFAVNCCYNLLEYNIEDGATPLTLEPPKRHVSINLSNINNVFKELYIGRSINVEVSATGDYYFINDEPKKGKPTGVEKITFGPFATSVDDIEAHLASNLKTVIARGQTPPAIADDFFSTDQYKNTTLYVPEGTSDKYKKAQGWQNFYNIVEEKLPTGISETESQAKMTVTAEYGGIMVRNAKGAIQVYTSAGSLIENATANGDVKITVPGHGVYVVKAGGETVKIAL